MKQLLTVGIALLAASHAIASVPHPFGIHDLVMLDRVSDPQISPDGKRVVYQVRETDFEANKGKNGLWLLDLGNPKAQPARLTDASINATTPRWSTDGATVFYLDKGQLWSRPAASKGAAVQVTDLNVDVNAYKLFPDGKRVLLSIDTIPDCEKETDPVACTKQRVNEKGKNKASGRVYDKLFIRHWDTWADGRRSQLYAIAIDANGKMSGMPKLLTRGIDGDVPSKPFGGDEEFSFSPDGAKVYFSVRIAGNSEP